MSAVKIALQQSQKSDQKKFSKTASAEVSPDSKCPICLDIFNNISYLDICLHKFCFRCIQEWSKNKVECPLCKQPFNSIYHSIKSDQDFKKYDLRPVSNSSFGTFEGVRFRYRTTLTGVRRRIEGTRTSAPPDNGVIFEPSQNSSQQRQDGYVRRMMMRLAANRRAAREGSTVRNVREQEMVNFRRELYRQDRRVRSVRDDGRSRDISAEFYRSNPACLHRLIPWLKRELVVLYGAHGSLVNIVQHIIMSRITRFDMEDRAILEELRPFLQGRTEHFLHEFISFAKSPFNMEAYDQQAVYDCPTPSSNGDNSSNSSVIAISEDEDTAELSHQRNSTSFLSYSMWDDETPGPSFSTTAEQSRTEQQSVMDSDSDSSLEETQHRETPPQQTSLFNQTNLNQVQSSIHEAAFSDSDDCVIVGFVKPTADRTPELVQLSSDSEDSENDHTKKIPLPRHIRFTSLSPVASQSSDPAQQSVSMESGHHQVLDSRTSQSFVTSSHYNPLRMSEKGPVDSASSKRLKENETSKDGDHRRRRRRRRRSEDTLSPEVSHSTYSTESGFLYPSGREYFKHDSSYRKRDGDHYTCQSYSHFRQERSESGIRCTQRKSYYYSSRKFSDRRSRSCSRDSLQRGRRRSRSLTYSSSRSPSPRSRSHHDKPRGKRKYKTRHLEEPSVRDTKHKKKKEKRHRKSKERSRRNSSSVSLELVNEGECGERSKRHHKKKKKHRKKSKSHKSSRSEKRSPVIIMIDSNSDSVSPGHVIQTSGMKKDDLITPSLQDVANANVMDELY